MTLNEGFFFVNRTLNKDNMGMQDEGIYIL